MGICRFRTIFLKFTQKRELTSSTSEWAKRRLRKPNKPNIVRELLEWATQVHATQTKKTKQIKHVPCERSELRQWAIQAQSLQTSQS